MRTTGQILQNRIKVGCVALGLLLLGSNDRHLWHLLDLDQHHVSDRHHDERRDRFEAAADRAEAVAERAGRLAEAAAELAERAAEKAQRAADTASEQSF